MKAGRTLLPLLLLAVVVGCTGGTDLSGKWVAEEALPSGTAGSEAAEGPPAGGPLMQAVLDLHQDGTVLTGTMLTHMFDLPISGGSVEGDAVSFATSIEMAGRKMEIPFTGKVVHDKIELSVQPPGGMPPMTVLLRRATEEEVLARAGAVPERIERPEIQPLADDGLARTPPMGWNSWNRSQETAEILTNPEVIAINQDPLGRQGRRVSQEGDLEVWAKALEDGRVAAGLSNGGEESATISARWADLELAGAVRVRDAWAKKDLGSFEDSFAIEVAPHGVALVVLDGR